MLNKWHQTECQRILVINTSATQANGIARDAYYDDSIHICDLYDPTIPPKDINARSRINTTATVGEADDDDSYISKVTHRVSLALSTFVPDFVIYNAGYDVLFGDEKGKMKISDSVVIFRDEMIFRMWKDGHDIPVLITIGSWYQKRQEAVIARSIRNLIVKFDLSKKPLEVGASEDYRVLYKATRGGSLASFAGARTQREPSISAMRGGSIEGVSDQQTIGFMSKRSNPLGASRSTAVKAVKQPTAYEENERLTRLKSGLLDQREVGINDHWSYKK